MMLSVIGAGVHSIQNHEINSFVGLSVCWIIMSSPDCRAIMGVWRSVLTIRVLEDRIMKIKKNGTTVQLWLSANDTYNWAERPGERWPCSRLSGKRLFAEFDDGDLIDYAVEGKTGVDIPGDEFTAITDDFIKGVG